MGAEEWSKRIRDGKLQGFVSSENFPHPSPEPFFSCQHEDKIQFIKFLIDFAFFFLFRKM